MTIAIVRGYDLFECRHSTFDFSSQLAKPQINHNRESHAMNKKTVISTEMAPRAIGPYSQGIVERTDQVFRNPSAIIQAAGGVLDDTVKITIFLTDMEDFKAVNEVYGNHFKAPYPARSAVQVAALPLGSNIETEAVVRIA